MLRKKLSMVFLLLTIVTGTAHARKSVFIISKHIAPSHAQAYAIDGNQVTYQADVNISGYNEGYGAVGIAVWPEKELMFVTYEISDMLVWSSTKTLEKVGEFNTNIGNCAGVAVDRDRERIYVVWRYTDDLYVYSWDDVSDTVVLDSHHNLQIPSGFLLAWGLALDEERDLLYVSTQTQRVHVYDTNDWSYDHAIDINVNGTGRDAVGIAVDEVRGYLYTGHWQSHNYLVRTSTSSPYSSIEVEITKAGSSPQNLIGVDVDEETGLVYCTTYHNDFRVYDSNLVLKDTETNDDISGPGGVAVGGLYKPPFASLTFDKVDDINDVNCVLPDDYITYTITYDPNGTAVNDINIVDYLPREVDVNWVSDEGVYDSLRRTVTWSIDHLGPNEANSVTLSVKVNHLAEPNGTITNYCEIESAQYYAPPVRVDTNVCCWSPDIIYVDKDRRGGIQTGMSWDAAYTDLQDALNTARHCDCNQIWVAEGTYKPTTDVYDDEATFELVDGVPLYGGFAGTETSLRQRNWMLNDTTLTGDIDGDGDADIDYVVTASEANEAVIDGFVITMGWAGIFCERSSATIRHNRIKENNYGIKCDDSDSNISNCLIENNRTGVYCHDNSSLTVRKCEIRDSRTGYGVLCRSISTALIENNWIHDSYVDGIYFWMASSKPLVRNNTIVNNGMAGIAAYEAEPQAEPNVTNCIIWGNWLGLDGAFGDVTYCCIEGDPVYPGTGNINSAPLFYDDPNDPNNYHLSSDSPCIDAGDPNFDPNDPNETDIDGEKRVIDGDANGTAIVDMGADEYYWSPADFDGDEIVNFFDYALLADNWRTTDDANDYNDIFDLADNNSIDYNDLGLFCEDWLWEAGWKKSYASGFGRGMGAMGGMGLQLLEETTAFYALQPVTAAKSQPQEIEPVDLEELLKWLTELWLTDEQLRKVISDDEWLKFVEAVASEL